MFPLRSIRSVMLMIVCLFLFGNLATSTSVSPVRAERLSSDPMLALQAENTCPDVFVIPLGDVPCLITAINAANDEAVHPGENTIYLTAGVPYILVDGPFLYGTGLPPVTSNIIIEGNGATIERDSSYSSFRIFVVMANNSLSLHNLTIKNGGHVTWGGAIYSEGTVNVIGCSFINNTADNGGALANYGGRLQVEHSSFNDNTGLGGAIRSLGPLDVSDGSFEGNEGTAIYATGMIQIDDSSFTNNHIVLGGAAISIEGTASDTATIQGSTFIGNVADGHYGGGAIASFSSGIVNISGSWFEGNQAMVGGAISAGSGNTTVANSVFKDNVASDNGSAMYVHFGSFAPVSLAASQNCIAGNSATSIYNAYSAQTMNFQENWWGAYDGPSQEGTGHGDSVGANIDFEPWLTATPPDIGDCETLYPPVSQLDAVDDLATTLENNAITIQVLDNDLYTLPIVITLGDQPIHGEVFLNPDNTVRYYPDENFFGSDTFAYQLCDTSEACDSATVQVSMEPVNDAPSVVTPSNQTSNELDIIYLPISATDSDSAVLEYSAAGLPTGLSINPLTGVITGTVAAGTKSSTPYVVRVTVSDGQFSPYVEFNWTVNPFAVPIDIRPGEYPNSIRLGSSGNVLVAILSLPNFDATTVDPLAVTLASARVRLRGNGTLLVSLQDVNGDGRLDLLVHINTETLQLSSTDTQAVLIGRTYSGINIRGSDSVRIVQATTTGDTSNVQTSGATQATTTVVAPLTYTPQPVVISTSVPANTQLPATTPTLVLTDTPTPLDTDGDGIGDDTDQCPTLASDPDGSDGCPASTPTLDSDGDGFDDRIDQCLDETGGEASTNGCPLLSQDLPEAEEHEVEEFPVTEEANAP